MLKMRRRQMTRSTPQAQRALRGPPAATAALAADEALCVLPGRCDRVARNSFSSHFRVSVVFEGDEIERMKGRCRDDVSRPQHEAG